MADGLDLYAIAEALRGSEEFSNKRRIPSVAGMFAALGQAFGFRNGDDAALIPRNGEFLLLACEGIRADLVREDPYLAGRCAVQANVNDIYAMGGYPLALVDAVGAPEEEVVRRISLGMRDNAARYRVPVVGGHLLLTREDYSVSLAVLGRAARCISSFDARPEDRLLLVRRDNGIRVEGRRFWNCTLPEDDASLLSNLELLPRCAESGLVKAGKDVSMSGIAGTSLMLAEGSGIGLSLFLDEIAVPAAFTLSEWLLAFHSYGFLLAVAPGKLDRVRDLFSGRGLRAAVIGEFCEDRRVWLCSGRERSLLWDLSLEPFAGAGG
ncbi:MAG: AIR synthase [Desulfovibrio sp.]|nr:AIR synthase [Desulfovibrio sp.]